MSAISDFVYGIVGTSIGFFGGTYLAKTFNEAKTVYYQDVNGDNLKDIVVESHNGTDTSFIQQPDGTYKSLDEHFASELGKTELQINSERKTIDERLKELKEK